MSSKQEISYKALSTFDSKSALKDCGKNKCTKTHQVLLYFKNTIFLFVHITLKICFYEIFKASAKEAFSTVVISIFIES